MHYKEAYLIAVCHKETNAILSAVIWSSPEWEQSRCLPDVRTYVAYSLRASTFQDGINLIRDQLQNPKWRYHYLLPYMNKEVA